MDDHDSPPAQTYSASARSDQEIEEFSVKLAARDRAELQKAWLAELVPLARRNATVFQVAMVLTSEARHLRHGVWCLEQLEDQELADRIGAGTSRSSVSAAKSLLRAARLLADSACGKKLWLLYEGFREGLAGERDPQMGLYSEDEEHGSGARGTGRAEEDSASRARGTGRAVGGAPGEPGARTRFPACAPGEPGAQIAHP